jgi:hypothetical protein
MESHIKKLMNIANLLEGQSVRVVTEDGEKIFGILVSSTQPSRPDDMANEIGKLLGVSNLKLNGIYINTGRKISFVDYDQVSTLSAKVNKK